MDNPREFQKHKDKDEEYYSKILFQRGAKNETRVWKIYVSGSEHEGIIHREHGVLHGKMIVSSKSITKGKNIGKSNETTPLQQAIFEAKSIATAKISQGYSETLEKRGTVDSDIILPMLAYDYHKQKKGLSFPCMAQPKIDGVRMIVEKREDGVRMTTRTGKPVHFMKHIEDVLIHLPDDIVLDGELFTTEKSFEEITSIVRKSVVKNHKPDEAIKIKYYVFDLFKKSDPDLPFKTRKELLNDILKHFPENIHIVQVPTHLVTDQSGADSIHESFVAEGHEGTMYRAPDSPYKIRLRSKFLLKRKDFITEEYKIISATEGTGKDKETVIWVVESGEHTFNVRPRGSFQQRHAWWIDHSKHIGKLLTVRFQNLTETGIPRFPVGLTFRDYE